MRLRVTFQGPMASLHGFEGLLCRALGFGRLPEKAWTVDRILGLGLQGFGFGSSLQSKPEAASTVETLQRPVRHLIESYYCI